MTPGERINEILRDFGYPVMMSLRVSEAQLIERALIRVGLMSGTDTENLIRESILTFLKEQLGADSIQDDDQY